MSKKRKVNEEGFSEEQRKLLEDVERNKKLRKEVKKRLKEWASGDLGKYDDNGMRI